MIKYLPIILFPFLLACAPADSRTKEREYKVIKCIWNRTVITIKTKRYRIGKYGTHGNDEKGNSFEFSPGVPCYYWKKKKLREIAK